MDGAPKSDEAEIAALLDRETAAFFRADFETFADCYVQAERFREEFHSSAHGTVITTGWDEFARKISRLMTERGPRPLVSFGRTIVEARVFGRGAWCRSRAWSDEPACPSDRHDETHFLEKGDDGKWRIVYCSIVATGGAGLHATSVEVDREGRVLWIGPDAAARLKDHAVLYISRVHLRSHRPVDGAALRAAIDRAGELTSQGAPLSADWGHRPIVLPAALGMDDEGRTLLCLVRISDGRIYVDLAPEADIARRLAAAAVLFGLSEAQAALVRRIAEGHSLPDAAAVAGITTATARTHLNRVYAKTGVNSQTALLRLLLSVG